MKATSFLILLFAGIAIAENYKLTNEITPQKLEAVKLTVAELPASYWTHLKEIVLSKGELKDGHIQADVTEYAKKVLTLIQPFIIKSGFDPLLLADQVIKLIPTGTTTLTNGTINSLSTISAYDVVIAKYDQTSEVLDLVLPLSFTSLSIDYKYKVTVVLLSASGGIEALINNVKLNLHMGFNFSSYYAFVDKADITDSGSIKLNFSGNGVLDWVVDLLSGVLTTLFHGIILNVINMFIDSPVDSVVSSINSLIDTILQRNSTSIY